VFGSWEIAVSALMLSLLSSPYVYKPNYILDLYSEVTVHLGESDICFIDYTGVELFLKIRVVSLGFR